MTGFLFLTDFEIVVNNEQLADMAFRLRKYFGNRWNWEDSDKS